MNNFFEELPDEINFLIFQNLNSTFLELSTLSQVSKKFYQLTNDRRFWRNYLSKKSLKAADDEKISYLNCYNKHYQKLKSIVNNQHFSEDARATTLCLLACNDLTDAKIIWANTNLYNYLCGLNEFIKVSRLVSLAYAHKTFTRLLLKDNDFRTSLFQSPLAPYYLEQMAIKHRDQTIGRLILHDKACIDCFEQDNIESKDYVTEIASVLDLDEFLVTNEPALKRRKLR